MSTGEELKPNPSKTDATLSPPAPSKRSLFHSICIVVTCTLAMIVNTSNGTAVAIALPTIGRDLHVPEPQLQWLVSAYSISSGCLLLVFGRLADLWGSKKIYIFGGVWMAIFSLGCSFARDEIVLDVLRGIQGIGASAIVPAAIGILARSFPPSPARSIAFATFSAGAPLGGALGMALGGLLTEVTKQSWRSVFYLSTGLTVLCTIGGIFSFERDPKSVEVDRRVDWVGAALVTVAFILIVFVLAQGELAPAQWRTPYVIVLLLVGIILFGVFLYWQHFLEKVKDKEGAAAKTPPPLMKLSLWRRGDGLFAVTMGIAFLEWCSFFAWNFWIQLYYQEYLHLSPLLTVVRLIPMFVVGCICNAIMALFVAHVPFVIIVAVGTLFTSTACLLLALVRPSAPYWAFGFPAAIVSVVGADFVFAAGSIHVAKVSRPEEQSLAGGVFQTMGQLGTALGVAVSTIVFDSQSRPHMGPPGPPGFGGGPPPRPMPSMPSSSPLSMPPPGPFPGGGPRSAPLEAYQAAQWVGFAFGALATILALVFLRGVGVVGEKKSAKKADEEKNIPNQKS